MRRDGRRGRGRAGVARGGVHNDSRIFVIAHECRIGDLAGEVVHDSQIHIGSVKLGLQISGDGQGFEVVTQRALREGVKYPVSKPRSAAFVTPTRKT